MRLMFGKSKIFQCFWRVKNSF